MCLLTMTIKLLHFAALLLDDPENFAFSWHNFVNNLQFFHFQFFNYFSGAASHGEDLSGNFCDNNYYNGEYSAIDI